MSNVSLTIQFASVDEALVALAAFSQVKVKTPAVKDAPKDPPAKITFAPAAAAATETKPPRKPRADRGQPRGPYNKKDDDSNTTGAGAPAADSGEAPSGQPAAPVAAEPKEPAAPPASEPGVTQAPQSPAQPSSSEAAPVAAAAPTEYKPEELQKKLEAVFAKGAQLAIDVLARFGVTRLANLDKQRHTEFVALCDKVIAGEQP